MIKWGFYYNNILIINRVRGLWIGWATGLFVCGFCLLVKMALVDWVSAANQILVVKEEKKKT